MREILFRGKRLDNGEWAEGFYLVGDQSRYGCSPMHLIAPAAYALGCGWCLSDEIRSYEVDPATVGQFTGLTDKNGQRIFEGDIVESEFTKKPYIVDFGEYTYTDEYGDEQSAFGWYNIEKGGYVTALGSPDTWATVIGNIHDNKPEDFDGG